jgi:hypothetical protein
VDACTPAPYILWRDAYRGKGSASRDAGRTPPGAGRVDTPRTNGHQGRATHRFYPASLDALNFLLADVRGALGPHLNVFLVTQQQWSQSTVGLVTVLSGWLTLAMQTPIAAVAGAIGWRFSQRVVFLLAPVFAVLAAAAAVPIIPLPGISLANFTSRHTAKWFYIRQSKL